MRIWKGKVPHRTLRSGVMTANVVREDGCYRWTILTCYVTGLVIYRLSETSLMATIVFLHRG